MINDDIDNIHTFVLLRYFLQRGISLGSGEELFRRLSKIPKENLTTFKLLQILQVNELCVHCTSQNLQNLIDVFG